MGEEFGGLLAVLDANPKLKRRFSITEAKPLPKDLTKKVIHAAENHINKGISKNKKHYTSYSDGVASKQYPKGTPTIGDGVAITSNAPKGWFNGTPVLASDVDAWTYAHLVEDDKAIRKEYDKQFGTKEYPHPSDTLSIKPRLGAAQVRYQQYRLGNNTDTVMRALANGNDTYLQTALYLAGKRNTGGVNRLDRVLDSIGGKFYK